MEKFIVAVISQSQVAFHRLGRGCLENMTKSDRRGPENNKS